MRHVGAGRPPGRHAARRFAMGPASGHAIRHTEVRGNSILPPTAPISACPLHRWRWVCMTNRHALRSHGSGDPDRQLRARPARRKCGNAATRPSLPHDPQDVGGEPGASRSASTSIRASLSQPHTVRDVLQCVRLRRWEDRVTGPARRPETRPHASRPVLRCAHARST